MAGRYLIDLTDARFSIPDNADVLEFIRRANPSAHSDVGSILFDLRKRISGAQAYCPSVSSFAYVVLHTASNRIFAIAFGQRGLAFRVDAPGYEEAVATGGTPASEIGSDWVQIAPWRPGVGVNPEVFHLAERAFRDAVAKTE
jgi:hypothetical protein